jgi:hypothetical protein
LFKDNSDELERWPLAVERSLSQPKLGDVTFGFSYTPEDEPDVAAMCQGLMDRGEEWSWENWSRVLMYALANAQNCWLHPEHVDGDLALSERHTGIVHRVTDSFVVVRYGEGDEAFESEYPRTQFSGGITIERGDRIEAAIGLWHQKHYPRGIDHMLSQDEQTALDDAWISSKGTVIGDAEI